MKETQDVMRETIQNCFAEMMTAVNGRLDRMQTEINERFTGIDRGLEGMDERLDGMDERFGQIGKRLDGIDERLDGMDERVEQIEKRLDGMDERLDGMDERFEQIGKRLDGMDERFVGIEKRLDRIDEQLLEHSEQLFILDRKLTGLALHVENETDKYIQILAENHISLTGKLNEGNEAHNGNKLYSIKVDFLIGRVDKLYDEVEGIKRQMKIRRPARRSVKALS